MINKDLYIGTKKGKGKSIFASRDFTRGEIILVICGPIITSATIYSIPINYSEFIDPLPFNNMARYLCHDCEPNAGIKNKTLLVAMRDIKKDEEIAIDYAMIVFKYGIEMSSDNVICNCHKPTCSGELGSFVKLSDDKKRKYKGYISEYLIK